MPDQQDDARGDDLTQAPNGLDAVARTCRAIIETPEGRRSKYDYDPESGLSPAQPVAGGPDLPARFRLHPLDSHRGWAPLDIMVFTDEPSPVGALIDTRIVGVIAAEQDGDQGRIRSDRIIGVAQVSTSISRCRRSTISARPMSRTSPGSGSPRANSRAKTARARRPRHPDEARLERRQAPVASAADSALRPPASCRGSRTARGAAPWPWRSGRRRRPGRRRPRSRCGPRPPR